MARASSAGAADLTDRGGRRAPHLLDAPHERNDNAAAGRGGNRGGRLRSTVRVLLRIRRRPRNVAPGADRIGNRARGGRGRGAPFQRLHLQQPYVRDRHGIGYRKPVRVDSPTAGGQMPPRGVKKGTKRARQYEHIKESVKDQGKAEGTAEEIAARTVNKERARSGESRRRSRSSVRDP